MFVTFIPRIGNEISIIKFTKEQKEKWDLLISEDGEEEDEFLEEEFGYDSSQEIYQICRYEKMTINYPDCEIEAMSSQNEWIRLK